MIQLRLLGSVDLRDESDRELRAVLAQPKRLALLAYLCTTTRLGPVRRDTVLGLFWPELDQDRARNALNKSLHFLRQALGDEVLRSPSGDELAVDAARLWCDVTAFDAAVGGGDHATALDLYRGELLAGVFVEESHAFEEWLDGERARLRAAAAHAAQMLARQYEQNGDLTSALGAARRALQLSDSDERVLRTLLELLDRAGDRASALQAYEIFASRLASEYQAEPAPETQRLVARIRERAHERSLTTSPDLAADAHVRHPVSEPLVLPPASARRFGTHARRKFAAFGLPLMVVLMAGSWLMIKRLRAPTTALSAMRVAVFPFDVRGLPQSQFLGEAVMDLLSEAVDGAGDIRRVHPRTIMRQLREGDIHVVDPSRGRPLAATFGAGLFILGTVGAVADTLRVSASLHSSADADPIATSTRVGTQENLAKLVESVALDLLARQTLGTGARLRDIGSVRTRNFAALRAYLEAEALLRRGWFDSAGVKLQEAVHADSSFGLAWYRLAIAQGWGAAGREGESFARAMQHRDSLSARDRLLVEGRSAFHTGDVARAESLASTLTGRFPDDVEAWHLLGLIRFWYRWQRGMAGWEARAPLLRALAVDPDYPEAIAHAALSAVQAGLYAQAESLLRKYPRGGGAGPFGLSLQSTLTFAIGDSLGQDSIIRRTKGATSWIVFNIAHGLSTSDSLRAAASVMRQLAEGEHHVPRARAAAQVHLGYVEMARGRRQAAVTAFAQATRVRPSLAFASRVWLSAVPFFDTPHAEVAALRDSARYWQVLTIAPSPDSVFDVIWIPNELGPSAREYCLGLIAAYVGDSTGAARHAQVLDRASTPPDRIGLRHDLALEIRALFAFRAGRPHEALALLERARLSVESSRAQNVPMQKRPLARFLRAEALFALGRYDEALGWYDTLGGRGWGSEYVYSAPKHLRMGEIYERKGNAHHAITHYKRFVAKWQDADAQYQPLVRDVSARIARLKK